MSKNPRGDITPDNIGKMTQLLKQKLGGAITKETLEKAWTQAATATSGITAYDLTAPAKSLVPVITPLRNTIPRVGGGTGIQANWRAITAVNSTNVGIGVAQGLRGAVQTVVTKDYTAPYATIGIEDYATDEAELASRTFDDLLAIVTLNNLRALMIGEEKLIIGGNNNGFALGTAATPTLAASASGGTLGTLTLSVIVLAMDLEAYSACDLTLLSATAVPQSGNRTLADGNTQFYNAGTGQKSANATVSVTGNTGSATATVTSQASAVAYAWFWGTAGSEVLGAITTINSVSITANAVGTQTPAAFAADYSQNSYVFNGILSLLNSTSSGAYIKTMATGTAGTGTRLTADGTGGCVEIDTALKSFWDVSRLTPTRILVSSQEQAAISQIVLAGTSTAAQRFVFNADQGNIKGGVIVRSYLNKFTMSGEQDIPIELHPNVPPGTIIFYSDTIPYPLSNVANVLQIKTRRDYHQIDWPRRTRRYEYGVYSDQVLEMYAPFAFGIINNIGAPAVI